MNNALPILVTGAGGFIGSSVVHRLLQDGHTVAILVKEETDLWRLASIRDQVTIINTSLHDREALTREMQRCNPKGVFHFAASNIASGVTAKDQTVVDVNLLGTKNLIDSLAEIRYSFFVQTGSFMEYGPKSHPIKEEEYCEPTELYSITKLGATLYGQSVAHQKNKPIVTLRLFTPYGPRVQAGRLVHEMIRRALANETIQLTDRAITRDFIFIDDLVDLCLEMMTVAETKKGEVFNCGSGTATTLETIGNTVLELTDSQSKIDWGKRAVLAYDGTLWQADMSKVFEHTTWKPQHTLEEGIAKTIKWMKNE